MTNRSRLFLFIPLSMALAGCDFRAEDSAPGTAIQVDTVDGVVHITQSGVGAWSTATPWRADTAHLVEIGAMDGPEPYVFGQVSGVVVGSEGQIYVADDQAKEVRIFSPLGEFLARFGRAGDGPGEFRNISGLGRGPDDGLAVLDGSQSRISVFDAAGGFQRFFRLERPFRILLHGSPVRFDEEGRYYDLTPLSSRPPVDSLGAIRYTPAGAADDTVLVSVHEPRRLMVMEDQRPMASLQVPYLPRPSSAIGPSGRIYTTSGDAYRIALLGASGDTVRVLRRTVAPIPVGSARRDSARDQLIERYIEMAGAAPRNVPDIPEQMPAILALQVDEEDHLWVLRPAADGSTMEWDVFDSDVSYLGELRIPMMNVMHIGESTIAGVAYDEMLVPTVRVIPIVRE